MSQSNIRLLRRERRLGRFAHCDGRSFSRANLIASQPGHSEHRKIILLPEADRCFRAMLRVADREDAKAVFPPVLWYRLVQRTLSQLFSM